MTNREKNTEKRPNIVLFVSDHFRREALGHTGNEVKATPFLDTYAGTEAVSFTHAFCQNPVCVPSRCSFLSGRYPHVEGFRTMHHLQSARDQNILRELKKAGYYVYFGGKNDVFKKEIPVNEYCDYRSDAFHEYNCIRDGVPLEAEFHSVLGKFTKEEILAAEKEKENSRYEKNKRNYYALYQGLMETDNPLAVGYTGLEDAQIEDALRFIKEYKGDRPLCIYLALMLPHPHYAATEADYRAIDADKIEIPVRLDEKQRKNKASILEGIRKNHRLYEWKDEELKEFKHMYYAMVHHIDHNFSRMITCLKEKGIYDDTDVLLFSDHGDYAGEYEIAEINQNTFEDVLTNIPLLIKPHKGIACTPRISEALIELTDVAITIAELTGIQLPESHFGISLLPLLEKEEEIRDAVFCEGGRLENEIHCTDGGHKPEALYWARTSVQESIPEHTKAVMIRDKEYKYIYRLYEGDEFYDLENDPKEMYNEIKNVHFEEKIAIMKERLLRFLIETTDCVPKYRDER
ncbi:sulfatase-like hydrolase/transferase [Mediterraneibacter massiliensis]|uniref:sulfatase-like hydrolase/transferase n=1 Tax=Mediterraneibacter massiliensis TaxID=1720300 RepID=UPI000E51BAB3|nr:sulfatase-like hydrolase/transferase [Mediterraneibacter massiliensis]RGT71626.1 DUF229 domain-containing protein [Ruminococcus sp. AF18-22]